MPVSILVEGKEDKAFLDSYIQFLELSNSIYELRDIGGKDKLVGVRNDIQSTLDKEEDLKVLIVFDANSDYSGTTDTIEHTLSDISFDMFLFPDNKSSGNLENLLEKIVKPEYKDIFDCFEQYKECLSAKNTSYEHPDLKAKIYAYKDALKIQGKEELMFQKDCWAFDSIHLKPLKEFFERHLS